ncbi:uncharacterized protein LOC144424382 isoform X1 [Styela clava]
MEFDDQEDLFVTVEKLEKIILSMETYISYQVSTKMPDKMRRRKFFTTAGMHVMSSDIRHCNQLTRVCLFNSNLNAELVHILKSNLEGSCLKIKLLDLSRNQVSELGDEGLSAISEIVHQCQVETLGMEYCFFNKDQSERFKALIAYTGVEFIVD